MLRITIELLPFGQNIPKTLGKIIIFNDGSGDINAGNYKIELYENDSEKIWKKNTIKKFPRLTKNVFELLYLGLKNIFEK